MKIVQLARMYSPHLGGVEIHLKEINSLLLKLGHEVVVVTTQNDRKLSLEVEIDGVKVYRIPADAVDSKQKTWNYISAHKEIFNNADIIHAHDVFWWLLPIYKNNRKKISTTFHGWETKFPIELNAKIQRYLYSKLSAGTIHVGEWIQKYYFDKPDFVTYGGINPKRFTKSNIDTENIKDKNDFNLVFIGRLEKDTEVDKYIDLVKKLKRSGLNISMTWVGDGSLKEECEKVGVVTGFVKNVSKHLSTADLVFATSYLSILEAQLLGKNVCAIYSNELKKDYLETYPGSKYMLISKSVAALVKKINLLVSSKKSFEKTARSAQKFASTQTWDEVLNIYLKLWKAN